jgi:alkylated DNA repair protein alkB family protein 6
MADAVAYHHAFITEAEEASLLSNLAPSAPGWTRVAGRAVRALGGGVGADGALTPAPLPRWAESLVGRLGAEGVGGGGQPPNHCLVNAYGRGDGILPHQDGPAYAPAAGILSLGGWAVLRFRGKEEEGEGAGGGSIIPPFAFALAPRSLVVFSGAAYERCLHGIDAVDADTVDASVVNVQEAGLWVEGAACGVCGDGGGGAPPAADGRLCACGRPATRTLARSERRVSLTVRRVVRVRRGLALRLSAR